MVWARVWAPTRPRSWSRRCGARTGGPRVIKNEGDDGWAVEIRKAGIPEQVLISPWVMGRDKKSPKPFDGPAFATFVKTASEVLGRSARQRDAALTKRLSIAWEGRWFDVRLGRVDPVSALG